MTKAEQRRQDVLRLRDEGLAEDEIADTLNISEAAVLRHLNLVEPPPIPRREPVVTEKKPPRLRSQNRLYEQPATKRSTALRVPKKDTGPGRHKRGYNGRPPAECGTESGYTKHRRLKETVCDSCKEVMRIRALKQRHDKRPAFASEQEAIAAASLVRGPRTIFQCNSETCQSWHYMIPIPDEGTRERRLERRRAHRLKLKLDTQQLTG